MRKPYALPILLCREFGAGRAAFRLCARGICGTMSGDMTGARRERKLLVSRQSIRRKLKIVFYILLSFAALC